MLRDSALLTRDAPPPLNGAAEPPANGAADRLLGQLPPAPSPYADLPASGRHDCPAVRRRDVLRGRGRECAALDRLLQAVRASEGRALVVRGEPGVGKSALLEYLMGRASGCRVAFGAGVQSEMELAFAGLHQLCAPWLDRLDRLPAPQRDALATAFGLSSGPAPDRFLVGLAVLSLLSDVAHERPLVCVVDDVQWLDRASAQALGFVARRLVAESVAVVFGMRDCGDEPCPAGLAGLPELVVEGLREADALALLDSVVRGPIDARVRACIVAETRGNPLALLELPRGLTAAQLAGGFALPDAPSLSGRIEASFQQRLERLPVQTRRLLLVAAAESLGEPLLVWRAAERLGIGVEAAAPAESAGLVEFRARVRFRHPLVRSAVYQSASAEDRRSAHRALAGATDPGVDPDRRAWHLAHATPGLDEDVAAELERSAGRVQARGGLAAAAAFLERATELTPDAARRATRALAAAQAKHEAGAPEAALRLMATAQAGPLDELQRARAYLLQARIAFASSRGDDAPPLLLETAKRLEPLDATLARETYLEACSAAIFAGRLAGATGLQAIARAARMTPSPPHSRRPADLLLEGIVLLNTEGHAAGVPVLKRALQGFRDENVATHDELRWLWLACREAMELWDDETWSVLSGRAVQFLRDAGRLAMLPHALTVHSGIYIVAGEFATAEALSDEAREICAATGVPTVHTARLMLAAWRGEAETPALIEACSEEAISRGEGRTLAAADAAGATFYNGLGRYADALAPARRSREHREETGFSTWGLVELVEAASRSGKPDLAADALSQLEETTGTAGTDWALGVEAGSRALLSEGEVAEELHREAIARLARTRARPWLARAHLVYGEWLRREKRRLDAREQLRIAHEMLSAMGVKGFAERAARELCATGETARKRTPDTRDELTAREAQIALLARDGLSNPQIGARLFVSPSTVDYHLRKVFAKLDIRTRHELDRVLPRQLDAAAA